MMALNRGGTTTEAHWPFRLHPSTAHRFDSIRFDRLNDCKGSIVVVLWCCLYPRMAPRPPPAGVASPLSPTPWGHDGSSRAIDARQAGTRHDRVGKQARASRPALIEAGGAPGCISAATAHG